MRVLLYFEEAKKLAKSGIGRAMYHQTEALKDAGIEYSLVDEGEFDLVHINTLFSKSNHILRKYRRKGIPVIVHGHSTKEDFRNSFRLWRVMALYFYPQLIYLYKHADMIITPTPYSEKLIKAYGINKHVYHLTNGIPVHNYLFNQADIDAFKNAFKITDQKVVIGIGFKFVRKGILDFIEVARQNPNYLFIWFGQLNPILTQQKVLRAIRKKPSNLLFPGYIKNEIIKGAMRYASCFFFPSYEETEGIVVLEAAISKTPLLVRRIGVYDQWLIEDVHCKMGNSIEEFNTKLNEIINGDNHLMVEKAYQVVLKKDLPYVGSELKKLYLKAIKEKQSSISK